MTTLKAERQYVLERVSGSTLEANQKEFDRTPMWARFLDGNAGFVRVKEKHWTAFHGLDRDVVEVTRQEALRNDGNGLKALLKLKFDHKDEGNRLESGAN